LEDQQVQVQQPTAQEDQVEITEPTTLEKESLQYLQTLDPFLHTSSMWQCTVTISRIKEESVWLFPSCYNCGRSCAQQSSTYQCSRCGSTKTSFRYKLTFYATDGTAEAEMFCFDTVARQIVGKPCEILVKSMNISTSIPTELSNIVGLSFTFAINININSYYSRERIFNVNSVIEAHGRHQTLTDTQESIEQEHSDKLHELSLTLTVQESPATAMQKLSTAPSTTLLPRSLTYSPVKDTSSSLVLKTEKPDTADVVKTVSVLNRIMYIILSRSSLIRNYFTDPYCFPFGQFSS
jgi:replication factor A1